MYSYQEINEQAFLWSIIFDNSILTKTKIQAEDFIWTKNKKTFEIFMQMKVVTPILFKTYIETHKLENEIWYAYLTELDESCEHSIFWKKYESAILDYSKKKKIINIKNSINEKNIYESMLQLNEVNKWNEKWSWVVDLVHSVWELLDKFKQRWQMLWYKWPFEILDKYYWGIIEWKVYTIIAYSNVWKTSFSYNYIVNAIKEWKRVRVFSTEEQKDKVFLNIIKAYYWKSIIDYMKDFYINMEDFEKLTVYDDINKLEDIIKETKKDDVIFIDFIQNIKATWDWEYEKMTTVAQELQRKAIQDNNIIFSISQVNNESRNKEANYMQPKWSWAIFASSDVILAIYKENEELKLNLLKNKFWPNNIKFLIQADFQKLQFKITEELETTKIQTDYNFK